jgi:phosphoribosyl 1,2-cyclic phosphodiesterase
MNISVASLNSGSNGNCYFIGSDKDAILIDAGISCREIEKRMERLGLDMNRVRAVFISHEHTDHIRGLAVLANRYPLSVYITEATRKEARLKLDKSRVFSYGGGQAIKLGSLSVAPFLKNHDAVDPYSFVVSAHNIHVGVFTDIGKPCTLLKHYFSQCHAAFLEANYDGEMLEKGNYPLVLKKRIRGGSGHLSNEQALQLFLRHRPAHMSHLFLSHLSKNNNSPGLVQALFDRHANGVKMVVASRYEESAVYTIGKAGNNKPLKLMGSGKVKQLSLGLG